MYVVRYVLFLYFFRVDVRLCMVPFVVYVFLYVCVGSLLV